MKMPNLKLASQKCCATCKWFEREEELCWCWRRPPYEDWMGRVEYENNEFMYDDYCDVHEGMVCDNWEAKNDL